MGIRQGKNNNIILLCYIKIIFYMLGLTYQILNTFTQITITNLKLDEARKFTPIPSNMFPQTNSIRTNLQPPNTPLATIFYSH